MEGQERGCLVSTKLFPHGPRQGHQHHSLSTAHVPHSLQTSAVFIMDSLSDLSKATIRLLWSQVSNPEPQGLTSTRVFSRESTGMVKGISR